MAGIFKAYDIRGIYGESLTGDLAFKIGRAFATLLQCRNVVVSRDMRPHSKPLFDALAQGLIRQGADVLDLGLCSTPMSNFANGRFKADAGIMITASHNPGEWNGFKMSRAQAVPISGSTGIQELEKIVADESFAAQPGKRGKIRSRDIVADYVSHVKAIANLRRPMRIAADMANAMGAYEARALRGVLTVDALFDTLDGAFPNHEANPMRVETLRPLQEKMRSGAYDFGVAFDGDADRVGFLDEKGRVIPMDLTGALIAQDILQREKGVVFYDLRSTRAFKEIIEESGGRALMSRVGHAFIKQQMRDANALFAGELSGHYYFRENYFTESSGMAALCIANIVSRSDRPLSELIAPMRRYHATGEINLAVANTEKILGAIRTRYADGRVSMLDGVSVEYPDWWFNVRASNTEPLVRLNLEARTRATMEKKRDEVLAIMQAADQSTSAGVSPF
ncbi:MAG: phosphomannomutase/phosphoglucomutase [Verrucomicrobiota bacterium]|nr:phosphomannomutase/phosphoglucomutase [Verrucomicrobiota bacterium]